jgi:prophage regulatory protein
MRDNSDIPERFISIKEFVRRSTLSRSEVYNKIADGELPKPIRLGRNRVAFPETVWSSWAASKMEAA